MRALQIRGVRVLNGADAFALELSKTAQAVAWGKRIIAAGKLDAGGIEYLEAQDGRLVFYDVNANSNLRPSIAQSFGFDPFERVVDFLVREMKRGASVVPRRAFA